MTAQSQILPGSDATDFTKIDFIVQAALSNIQTVSICKVVAVHTGSLTVDVQVLVNLMTSGGASIPHGVIYGRPYLRLQGGDNGIICDPAPGDLGVLVFGSRDGSGVIAAKAAANPGSQRQFDWADGIYLGGILNGTPTQFIQFGEGGITITSPTAIAVHAPTINIGPDSGTAINIGAASGTVTTIDGKEFLTHVHTLVESGSSDSGPVGP